MSLIFALIRKAVEEQRRSDVEEECILGVFSFSKFLMWNDILAHRDKLQQNDIIKSLVERHLTWTPEQITSDLKNIDEQTSPTELALPMPIDSSQLAAVIEGGNGHSFILGGERRLNVAISRAREEMYIYSSLQAADIDLRRSKAKDIVAVLLRKFKGAVKTVTISMTPSGKYYASVLVDTDIQALSVSPIQHNTALGIDLGIKSLAVCSDERTFDNPKLLQGSLKRLSLLQKRLSRKQKGPFTRNKARIRVARLQEYIANSRKDNLQKITYALTHDSQVRTLCMENLNVNGMQRNHHLAQVVGDVAFGMFLTLLDYKCKWCGVNLVKIDPFSQSSKTRGECGYVYKGLKLRERSWSCPECGTHHDRGFNAACNIKEFDLRALPTERGKVKPVDCPLVDDRPRVLKSNGRKKQEKRGGIATSEAAKSLG